MCGLLAVIPKRNIEVDSNLFSECLHLMKHRGPDNSAVYFNSSIAMGHTRLAIIDRNSKANQPFTDDFFENVLIFNGEIYNYVELRKDLEKKGISFHTESDTEVLYLALSIFGASIIPKLNGMFAFIFWDKQNQNVIVSRDRYGIKPLFFHENENAIIFSSEIKSINLYRRKNGGDSPTINKSCLYEYLIFQNLIDTQTFFEGISKFKAGTFREISLNNRKLNSQNSVYWTWEYPQFQKEKLDNYSERLEHLLQNSVRRQLVGDVKLGTFLSGGIDSSLINYFASKSNPDIISFTVGFQYDLGVEIDNFSDEVSEAQEISNFLGIENHKITITQEDLYSSLSQIVKILEEPRMGQSYPNYFASKLASQHSLVVLSGAGGDELFGGYPWRYRAAHESNSWEDLILKHFVSSHKLLGANEIASLLKSSLDYGDLERPNRLHKEIFNDHAEMVYNKFNATEAIMKYDAQIFLEGLLNIEDKIGMNFSIETRFPFLDNELVDFVSKYRGRGNDSAKASGQEARGKEDLRRLTERLFPAEVSKRKKQGFTGPDSLWFRSRTSAIIFSKIFGKNRAIWDYLDYDACMSYIKLHQNGDRNLRHLIWSLLSLSEFFEKNAK
jgi:asparagine synthase (glutamine-hydrolysing)